MNISISKLLADKAGNTMALIAVAMVPMTIMIGGGMDVGVAYMAKTKLQNACDAGVLAGRQAMQGTKWTSQAEAEAKRLFDFNFPAGTNGVEDAGFEIDQDQTDGTNLIASAQGEVPTLMMGGFGYDTLKIEAECEAKFDLGHNDVMMVLDVTLSMKGKATGGGQTKIAALRNGASGLYRALANSEDSITRFGVVPYANNVNVAGSLNDSDILTDQWFLKVKTETPNKNPKKAPKFTFSEEKSHIRNSKWGSRKKFRLSGEGCIEERSSIGTSSSQFKINSTVTRDDIDLRASNDRDTARQFGRFDPDIQSGYNNFYKGNKTSAGCPGEAFRLRTFDSEYAFNQAINKSTAKLKLATYHDIGMLWGTRFVSSTGMFADDNPEEIGGVPVNKHIVFLTDGLLWVRNNVYSSHGVEQYQKRTKGSGNLYNRHKARFLSTCETAKSMGITVWVIALDVSEKGQDTVRPCATSAGHFFLSDGSDLEDTFSSIGQGIGNLRLTK